MPKRLTSLRISDYTTAQIEQLTDRINANQSEIIMLAVDRMYRDEFGKRNPMKEIDTMTANTHWSDITGRDISATQAYVEARASGLTVAEWLEQTSRELWEAQGEHDADANWGMLARQLTREAAGEVAYTSERGEYYDGPNSTTLEDWLAEGNYDGTETVESLAAEWDK